MTEHYKEFIRSMLEEGHDPTVLWFHHGLNGILREFEEWLKSEGLLKEEESNSALNLSSNPYNTIKQE